MHIKPRRNVFTAMARGMFQSAPRYKTPIPAPNNAQWWYSAGPAFTPGLNGAILQSRLSKPWVTLPGYAYRVANPQHFSAVQPPPLFAPKGVPLVGINIQLGSMGVETPAVNDDGTFAQDSEAFY
jgi:hypothetical protein